MRLAVLSVTLGVAVAFGAVAGLGTVPTARAELPPNVQTINVYRSSFSPSMMWDMSGVVVTLVNRDSIPHNIVLYRDFVRTSLAVTLASGQRYTLSEPLTCTGDCYNATYVFADANRSNVSSGYCNSFCGRLWIDNPAT
jgi:hypothetical protein